MKKILLLFFLFYSSYSFSQDKKYIDSLLVIAQKNPSDTNSVNAYRYISWEYEGVNNKLYFYYCQKALEAAQKINDLSFVGYCLMDIGIAYEYVGQGDSALIFYKKSEETFKQVNDLNGVAAVYINMASTYRSFGNFSKALECNLYALRIAEKIDKKDRIADCKNAIGNIYRQKNNLSLALKYSLESLGLYSEMGDLDGVSRVSNNIGIIYSEMKDSKKALDYYFKSLEIRLKSTSLTSVANCYSSIACEYYEIGELNKALEYHDKALSINEKINNQRGIAIDKTNIAAVYTKQKKYFEAILILKKAQIIAEQISFKALLEEIYLTMSDNYNYIADYKNAYEYHKLYTAVKNEIINDNENSKIAEMQAKYDTDKKDSEIKLLNKDKEIQSADLERKSTLIWASFVGLFLSFFLVFFIFRSYKAKQKANDVITAQKKEVEMQKEIIEEKQKEILDSIHYAKHIQQALLPSEKYIEKQLSRLINKV